MIENLKLIWDYLKTWEPARLKALLVAVAGVLAVFGVAVPAGVDLWLGAAIAGWNAVLAFVQGEQTRKGVFAPGTVLTEHEPRQAS